MDNDNKQALINRLKRIEGQIRGIRGMIEDDKYCFDILTQIMAARSALTKSGELVLENHVRYCLQNSDDPISENKAIEELITALKAMIS